MGETKYQKTFDCKEIIGAKCMSHCILHRSINVGTDTFMSH